MRASDPASTTYDFAVIGGGIVGLATALALADLRQDASILLLEKEKGWGEHQTGHNSGVIHSGVYYRPGSLKARMAVAGNRSMVEFCRAHAIPHAIPGKLIVAISDAEVPRLRKLQEHAVGNGVEVRWLSPGEWAAIEPHVQAVAAIHVPSTGVVDYRQVAMAMATVLGDRARLQPSARVERIRHDVDAVLLETTVGPFRARTMVNCAGLFSDRIARASGERPDVRIVPFRGEYYEVGGASAGLVHGLVYPVPNPHFPFLGVHLTRGIDGRVHAGPNAVLAFKREGYTWKDFSWRDTFDTLTFAGFWRLAARNWSEGLHEITRSLSRRQFTRSLQRLIPEISERDLEVARAGVRAQALTHSGALADDFVVLRNGRAVHVCNAPSPAATASLEIGRYVAEIAVGDS
jgi:L-2-hydroxyglutarate oxidase